MKDAGVKDAGVVGVASGVAIVTLAIGRATERAADACMHADRGAARAVRGAAVSRGCAAMSDVAVMRVDWGARDAGVVAGVVRPQRTAAWGSGVARTGSGVARTGSGVARTCATACD